jgi:hypothetical protein
VTDCSYCSQLGWCSHAPARQGHSILPGRIAHSGPGSCTVLRAIPNSRHSDAMLSPSLSLLTKRMLSSHNRTFLCMALHFPWHPTSSLLRVQQLVESGARNNEVGRNRSVLLVRNEDVGDDYDRRRLGS